MSISDSVGGRSFDEERAHLAHEGGEGRVVGAEWRRAQQLERLLRVRVRGLGL